VENQILFWIGFHVFIAFLIFLDLGIFRRKHRRGVTVKEGIKRSCTWVGLALLFNLFVYLAIGPEQAIQFFTGYLIEKSLSIDNLFVFLVIFSHFKIEHVEQLKILYWGIIGALVMRLTFILGGLALIHRFHWILYLFGAMLCLSGLKFALEKEKSAGGWIMGLIQLFAKRLKLRKFLLVLIIVEVTDLIFALDSIPAVFAVTTDPFIVYTSNVFAVLGLRALHQVLAASISHFSFLKVGLGILLVFVGLKMLVAQVYPIPMGVTLAVVVAILSITFAVDRLRNS